MGADETEEGPVMGAVGGPKSLKTFCWLTVWFFKSALWWLCLTCGQMKAPLHLWQWQQTGIYVEMSEVEVSNEAEGSHMKIIKIGKNTYISLTKHILTTSNHNTTEVTMT